MFCFLPLHFLPARKQNTSILKHRMCLLVVMSPLPHTQTAESKCFNVVTTMTDKRMFNVRPTCLITLYILLAKKSMQYSEQISNQSKTTFPKKTSDFRTLQLIELRLSLRKRKLWTMSGQGMLDYCSFRRRHLENYLCSKWICCRKFSMSPCRCFADIIPT